jgi:hypothetical protein
VSFAGTAFELPACVTCGGDEAVEDAVAVGVAGAVATVAVDTTLLGVAPAAVSRPTEGNAAPITCEPVAAAAETVPAAGALPAEEALGATGGLDAWPAAAVWLGSAACGSEVVPSAGVDAGSGRAGRRPSGSTYPCALAVVLIPK